ncbi:NAD(P)/FAD-dependent oxidoreductase [Neorhizobium sp. IRS_2294]|uniref:NAD(P)/FAD-dependent oxidoreductase n=1 Tax=unclassified Neorhizobium TaxID=2629175 RepID=UPI003D2BCA01
MADVVVIGAGISGASTAYELAVQGHDVVLVDRYGPAAMASGWTMAGVRQSGRHPAELPLARAAVDMWASLHERLDGETHYRRGGNLRCARTPKEVEAIHTIVASQSSAGLDIRFLDREEVRSFAPYLSKEILAASFCATDGQADAVATVNAFVNAAERAGAKLRFGERVLEIAVSRGHVRGVVTDKGTIPASRVVLAGGVYGNELLEPLGHHVPFQTMSATMIRTSPVEPKFAQVIGVANGDTTGRQEVGGHIRLGGGHEVWDGEMDHNPLPSVSPTLQSVQEILQRFTALVPFSAELKIDRMWCGLIDQSVDAIPVIQQLEEPAGLVIAMGFSGHGFCLGPVTGKILSALAVGNTSPYPIEPFRIDRFPEGAKAGAVELHG